MKIIEELVLFREVVRYSFCQIIQINASELNKLHKHYPKLEKFLRRHVIPASFILLDEEMS
jgi:hypothetical protein